MKKLRKYIFFIVLFAVAGGITWWQFNKKRVVRHEIEKAVSRGTDSTYYIHYDSSRIDALGGNAVFYNIVLQSDSLQKKLYSDDTADIAKMIFNVHIEKLVILGANIPSFLNKNTVEAQSIEIVRPVITVIKTGKKEFVKFNTEDSLAIYEKLTGRFKSIQAGEIKITDGTFAFAKGKQSPYTTLQGIGINLQNLKIDSTRNYNNIISYFIKDVQAEVKNITVKNEKSTHVLSFTGAEYNAPGRLMKVDRFLQTDLQTGKALMILSDIRVSGLSPNSFILNRVLKADSLVTSGGEVVFYRNKKKSAAKETIDMDNTFFDEAIIKNIRLGSTTITIISKMDNNTAPLVLKNIHFNAYGIDSAYNGTDILQLIGKSNWDLSGAGLTLLSRDKIYRINIGPFLFDNFKSFVSIKNATIIPVITKEAFIRSIKFQKDLYDLKFENVRLTGTDVKKILTDQTIIAEEASLKMNLHIFNDRTVTPDTANKIGKYPQQLLQKIGTGIFIKNMRLSDSYILYTERGAISKKTGDVFFTGVNGTISNITNIEGYKNKNSNMKVLVNTKFLGIANISSEWNLPLSEGYREFKIKGTVGSFNGIYLNPVIEPLGMASIHSGNIAAYSFNMHGNDFGTQGECVMLYDNLKIKLLKNTGDNRNTLKSKIFTTALANVLIKDQNTATSPRKGNMAFKRATTKTFFNLVWKSIFAGAKSSVRP